MSTIIKAFISCSIAMIPLYFFGYIIFKDKEKDSQKKIYNIIIFLIGCILHTIIFLYVDNTLKTILFCIMYMLVLKLNFNISFSKAIFSAIIYIILLIIPDLITLGIGIYIFGVSKEYYYANLAGGIICSFCVNSLMILLTYILRKPLKKLINYNISPDQKIIFISFLTLISLTFFFYNLIKTFEFSNNIFGYILVIATLIIILFSMYKQKNDNENLKSRYDELLDIMKTYETDIEEQKTKLHETKNEIMTIKCKINDTEDKKVVIKYIDSILGDKESSNISKYAKFKYLPANGLKGFFYYKFMEAERKNINVSVNISQKIEKSFLNDLNVTDFKHLVRIIGVYLDNAIEASNQSKEKKLGIEVYLINSDAKIIITNTFVNNIDLEKVGTTKFSTKGRNRGHGLLLVKSILNNNKIFEAKREIISNLYVQELTVKKPKK